VPVYRVFYSAWPITADPKI